jgi:hypothetical protein
VTRLVLAALVVAALVALAGCTRFVDLTRNQGSADAQVGVDGAPHLDSPGPDSGTGAGIDAPFVFDAPLHD